MFITPPALPTWPSRDSFVCRIDLWRGRRESCDTFRASAKATEPIMDIYQPYLCKKLKTTDRHRRISMAIRSCLQQVWTGVNRNHPASSYPNSSLPS